MSNKPPAVYWDACCFIGRIQRESGKIADLEHLTELAGDGKLLIVTSVLTITEVLQEPSIGHDNPDAFRTISEFFEHPWIVLRGLTRRIAESAAQIRRDHHLKVPDAVHVATALAYREILALHTYDSGLLNKDGGIGTPALSIIRPRYPEDHPLFDAIPAPEGPTILRMTETSAESESVEPEGQATPDPMTSPPTALDSAEESPTDLDDEPARAP